MQLPRFWTASWGRFRASGSFQEGPDGPDLLHLVSSVWGVFLHLLGTVHAHSHTDITYIYIYMQFYAYIAFVRDRFGPRVCLNALNSLLFKHRLTENV